MNAISSEIRAIPLKDITVLNPRSRNKKIFSELVTSIAHLGLKKPITVSARKDGSGYDLVCGQGRLEAFVALGQTEIPAIVIDASVEDCYVMSLVENLARRQHSSLEFVHEICTLRERGYTIAQIAAKTDFSEEYVNAACYLLDHGEERLLTAVEKGIIPPTIAKEIARAKDGDVQKALAEAYERKTIPGNQFLAIRRIVAQRNLRGKTVQNVGTASRTARKKLTATALVSAYRKETERQKFMVKKATLAQSRLLFVVNALRRLLADEHFVTLLRAESMSTMPRPLADALALEVEVSENVRVAFDRRIVPLPTASLLACRKVPDNIKNTPKYERIAKSVSEIGIIEPLVVAPLSKRDGRYLLLDGHVRLVALLDLGQTEVRCIIADDDEAFTYNKRVNHLATVQEHFMIVRALERGCPKTNWPRP